MTTQVFTLPDLGEGLTEADLVTWLVAEGDTITVDQPIAEVETAKALVEVPSPYAGTVVTLHGAPGETLHVGNPLITVTTDANDDGGSADQPGALGYREEERAGMSTPEGGPDEAKDSGSGSVLIGYGTTGGGKTAGRTRRPKRATPPPATDSNGTNGTAPIQAGTTPSQAPRVISPLVRQLAKRHNLQLAELTGTGPHGMILRADVQAAIDGTTPLVQQDTTVATPAPQTASATGQQDSRTGLTISQRTPVQGVRKMIAQQMVTSRTTIPEATSWLDVDVTELVELQARLKTENPDTAPSIMGFIARFVTAALHQYPVFNSRLDTTDDGGQEIIAFDGVNLGVATQTERGLMVPAVAHANTLSARQLTTRINELVTKTRQGEATVEELTRGTFTLNNYGVLGVDGAAAIINTPEVAIFGVGRIMDRPWVVNGQLAVRKVTELTLTFDHRITDGAEASAFLTTIANAMHHPVGVLADL